jgi:hypothetical protein
MITNPVGWSSSAASAPTGMQRAPSTTAKGGGSVAGTRYAM